MFLLEMQNPPTFPWMRKQWRPLPLYTPHCLRELFLGDEAVEDADQADQDESADVVVDQRLLRQPVLSLHLPLSPLP